MAVNVFMDREARFPHWVHLLLTFCSCGLWFPVWVSLYLGHKMCGGRG